MKTYRNKPDTSNSVNRRIGTIVLAAIMLLSISMVLTYSTQPTYGASGTLSLSPTVFSHSSSSTVVLVNGGTFGSGSTVKFYASSTTTFTSSNTVIGTYSLTSGSTTFSSAQVTLNPSLLSAGSWYVAASDDSGSTFTGSVAVTVSSLNPTLTLSTTPISAGSTEKVTGSGFDSGSTVTLYLNYVGGTTLVSGFASSDLSSGVTFTVPTDLPGSSGGISYTVVGQETSSSSANYGITADKTFSLTPSVTVSPTSISGATSSSFTVTGHGFPASKSFSASTSTSPVPTFQFAGVDAINPSFTSDTTGSFSVGVTGLSSAITLSTYNGPVEMSVRDSSPTTYSNVGTITISQPDSALLGYTFAITATTGSTYNVNDAVTATVWDFPASTTISFWLGPTEIGTVSTDSNGAAQLTTVIPAMAAGTYTPIAMDNSNSITTSPTSGTTSYSISAYFQAIDPARTALISATSSTGEYVPSSGLITIQAYGLNPTTTTYDFYDSLVATSGSGDGVGATGLVTTLKVGSESSSTGEFQSASNGTLIFTYSPGYTSTSTGTSATITSANSVNGYSSNSYGYYVIGTSTLSSPSSYAIIATTATGQGISITGLIPYTAALYPGVNNEYNAYLGTTELTLKFTNHNSVSTSGSIFDSGDTSLSFNPPGGTGLFDLNITYNGESVASSSVASEPIVISAAGTSPSDGSLTVAALSTAGDYEVVGYGYETTSSLSLYYAQYGSTVTSHETTISTTDGAFAHEITPGSEPAGTYSVFTVFTSGGVNYYHYSSYTVSATLKLDSSTTPSGSVGASVTISTTGLITAPGYYALYFGSDFIEYSSSGGTFSSFDVPTVKAGSYNVAVKLVGSTIIVASQTFKVKANTDITLGTDSQYAFPTELVSFDVKGLSQATAPAPGSGGSATFVQTYAIVDLNGTLFAQVPAKYSSSTLKGYFQMPNANAGSYYALSFAAVDEYSVKTETSTGLYVYSTDYVAYTGSSGSEFLGVVSGNGAFITGISQSQIAQLETDINTTLSVPISQLDASVVSIQNSVAQISTEFGTMSASLSSINATVNSIDSGVVTLGTSLGSIRTSLSSLNATIIALNGDTAKISTAVGVFNTTINNINATVSINKDNIATISTDLGTFTGNVTSVSKGIATIQTSLGTIKTNTNQIVPTYGTSYLLEIVIVVLAVLAVVFSALAMANTRRSLYRRD